MRKRIAEALVKIARKLYAGVEPIQAHNVIVTQESKAVVLRSKVIKNKPADTQLKEFCAFEYEVMQSKQNLLKDAEKFIKESHSFDEVELKLIVFKP